MAIISAMSVQKRQKLNHLLRELGDADLASAAWLRQRGYSSSLLARYVRSGWLNLQAANDLRLAEIAAGGRIRSEVKAMVSAA